MACSTCRACSEVASETMHSLTPVIGLDMHRKELVARILMVGFTDSPGEEVTVILLTALLKAIAA